MPRFAASDLGLHCLPKSHKKDARLKWVKDCIKLFCLTLVLHMLHQINAMFLY